MPNVPITPRPGRGRARYAASLAGQAAGRGLYLLSGFAAFVMVAKGAGPAALGHYAVAVAAVALTGVAADFGTTLTFSARIGACPEERRAGEVAAMLSARLILGGIVGLALLAALPLLPAPVRPALALAAFGMPLLAARFCDPLFQVCGRPGWSALPALANAAILVAGTGLALWLDLPEAALALVMVASGVSYGAASLALAALLLPLRAAPFRIGLSYLREALPLGVSNALGTLNGRIGLMAVALVAGAAEAGVFTAGYRFFELGIAVAITVASPLVPVFARAAAERPGDLAPLVVQVRTALRLALSVTLPLSVAAWWLAGPVVGLVFGAGYEASVPVLRLAAFMSAAMLAATILFAALVAMKRDRFAIAYAALGCAANLGLCAALVPASPATGAALAALGSELAMLAFAARLFAKAAGAPLAPADLPRLLLPSLILALLGTILPDALAPAAMCAGALVAIGVALAPVLARPRSLSLQPQA